MVWLLLIFLIGFANSNKQQEENDVLILQDSTFNQAIDEFTDGILILFHVPWCGHCLKMMQDFRNVAKAMKSQEKPTILGKIDASVSQDTAIAYEVNSYPTLLYFVNKEPIEYRGSRTEADMISWLKKKKDGSIQTLQSLAQIQTFLEKNKSVAVFQGTKDEEKFGVYEKACKDWNRIFCTFLDKKGEAQQLSLNIFTPFDEEQFTYLGNWKVQNLVDFGNYRSIPIAYEFDEKLASYIFQDAYNALFMFLGQSNEKELKILKKVGQKLKGSIIVTHTQITDGIGKRLAELVGVKKTPEVFIIQPIYQETYIKKYKLEQTISEENIMKLIEDFKQNKTKQFLRTQPLPTEIYENYVRVLVGSNFKEVVYEEKKDVLVYFYAS